MNNALKFEEMFGMTVLDLFAMKEFSIKMYMDWLNKEYKEQKPEKEEPQSEEKPDDDCNKLGFEDLCNYIGIPVFVIYPEKKFSDICSSVITTSTFCAEKRRWEIVAGVKKTEAHEYVLFRGQNDWLEIDKLSIYSDNEVVHDTGD